MPPPPVKYLCPHVSPCSITPFGVQLSPFHVRNQFSFIFFDRRKLKLSKHIEQVPENERSRLVLVTFQKLFDGYNKTIDAVFRFQRTGAFTESYPDGVVWAMYATARFGSSSDLLMEIDRVRVAAKAYFDRIIKEERVLQPSRENIQNSYPDNRVMLNCMALAIKRRGAEGLMSEFFKDLRMEKLAIPQWDAPATMAEAAEYVLEKTVLQMNASYPAYVTIGYDWKEIILYVYPLRLSFTIGRTICGESARKRSRTNV